LTEPGLLRPGRWDATRPVSEWSTT